MRFSTGSGRGISAFIPVGTSEDRSRTVRRIFAMQLGGHKCIWVYARRRGLPWTHSVQRLNAAYSIKPHFLQFPNFCQITRCLPSSWPGRSASWMRHPAPCTLFQHHLSLKLPQFQKISIQTHLLGTQTEAIIQISTWSLNSFSLFFNFDPTPPPPLLHWKGPRQQPGKWGRQNRPPLFTFVLLALYWGEGLKGRTGFGRQRSLASHPSSETTKTLGWNSFHRPLFTLSHNEREVRTFSFPLPLERICWWCFTWVCSVGQKCVL